MSRHKATIVTACAYWASALCNGDESSITDHDDRAHYEAFVLDLEARGLYIVDVVRGDDGEPQEPRFTWNGHLYGCSSAGTEVLDYVAHRITRVGDDDFLRRKEA